MNNNIQVIIKSSTAEMSLNDHEAGIYIVPELNGLTGLPNIRTTSGVNAGYDGGWTTAQNYDARTIILRGTIANEDKSKVEQMRKQLVTLLGQGKKEPLTFDIVTETGKAYELQIRTIACDMAMQKVLTRQDFMITFRADDPLIYDNSAAGEPVTIQVQKALGGFQIDFELPLAIGGSEDAAIVENNGQEEVFPIVKMYGALHNPTIINQTTNQQMQLDVDLGYAEGAPIVPASVSGNPITITDAVDAPLADYEILGNTTQNTLSGKNLFNKTAATLNYRIGSDGSPYGDNAFFLSDFIPVEPNTEYRITPTDGYSTSALAYYDSSKTFIRRTLGGTWYNVNTPANAAYIRFATNKGYIATAQCEKGNAATTYEPYCGGVASPNPDYPQAVNTVTGRQVVKVEGKNLLDSSSENITQKFNCTTEDVDNGIKVDGTSSGSLHYATLNITSIERLLGQEVTITCNYAGSTSSRVAVYYIKSGGQAWTYINELTLSDGVASKTFTMPNSLGDNIGIGLVLYTGENESSTFTNLQIEKGSTATDYEPYQGQSYEVNLGKNLFYAQDTTSGTMSLTYDSATGKTTISGTPSSTWAIFSLPTIIIPAGTYTMSIQSALSFNIALGTTNAGGTRTTKNIMAGNTSYSFTISEVMKLDLSISGLTSGTVMSAEVFFQLEKGSQASPYAAYFEPIELCKIGTYQDYIYKSGGKWYVHEAVGKWIVNPNDTWYASGSHTVKCLYANSSIVDPIKTDTGSLSALCAYMRVALATALYQGTTSVGFAISSDGVYISNNDWTVDQLKTWATNNQPKIYYPLATPTDAEITNSALIEQLDALWNARTQSGVTNISLTPAGGATGSLDVTYYTGKNPDIRDEVIIDSRLRTITLNGTDIYSLQTEGSEFLMLAPGQNRLLLRSDNTSDNGYAEVNYKQGYLSI